MSLDQFFVSIKDDIEQLNRKSSLQEIEHQFDLTLIPYKSIINEWINCSPTHLSSSIIEKGASGQTIYENYHKYKSLILDLDCKPSQKERFLSKFLEDSIYILVANRYFLSIANGFITDPIEIPMITNTVSDVGVIMNPNEVAEILFLDKIDYQSYLLALLRLVDTIVEYTTTTVINESVGSSGAKSANYSISIINSQIVSKLQNGFQLLDLKNDMLRKRYDSLKYNSQRLNKIVYDLSLRNLITTKGEVI
ncbi:Translin, putative (Recombination hotspot binding protein, putative) [Candida maltosa Xu316]|uniref:Translin, putative (Recombination hotspot binding protein, putative) n=1 Tax=Candida maltosa (strain Xu316) TaxID=1245528 RepID=M3K2V1_CANMX|nr:Translin, putative (Recombination hotspot binding protein, putative) [Candida maltosa Xu316]